MLLPNNFNLKVLGTVPLLVAALAFIASPVNGQITYVDMDTTNTLAWNSTSSAYEAFVTAGAADTQGPSNDGLWDLRTFANEGTIFQNAGSSQVDNAQRLEMTVGGLLSETYDVYAYFWVDTQDWRLEASLTDNVGGDLPVFDNTAPLAVPADFADPSILVAEGNRLLYQASLGQVTGTSISVYLDDFAGATGQEQRAWIDGIGFEVAAVPEPAAGMILGLATLFVTVRRRKS